MLKSSLSRKPLTVVAARTCIPWMFPAARIPAWH